MVGLEVFPKLSMGSPTLVPGLGRASFQQGWEGRPHQIMGSSGDGACKSCPELPQAMPLTMLSLDGALLSLSLQSPVPSGCNPLTPLPSGVAQQPVLTPSDEAQLCQVVVYVGAKDLDEEKVEMTAFQHSPGEAAEQAVVSEPPQGTAQPRHGPAGDPTVEQESQVEQQQAADQVHVKPQVGAEALLRPELLVVAPGREQKRPGAQLRGQRGPTRGGEGHSRHCQCQGRGASPGPSPNLGVTPYPRGFMEIHQAWDCPCPSHPQTQPGSMEPLAHPTLRKYRRQW